MRVLIALQRSRFMEWLEFYKVHPTAVLQEVGVSFLRTCHVIDPRCFSDNISSPRRSPHRQARPRGTPKSVRHRGVEPRHSREGHRQSLSPVQWKAVHQPVSGLVDMEAGHTSLGGDASIRRAPVNIVHSPSSTYPRRPRHFGRVCRSRCRGLGNGL